MKMFMISVLFNCLYYEKINQIRQNYKKISEINYRKELE